MSLLHYPPTVGILFLTMPTIEIARCSSEAVGSLAEPAASDAPASNEQYLKAVCDLPMSVDARSHLRSDATWRPA